jgi:homoserine kinase
VKIVRAFSPASVANVAVGFDLLGFSMNVTGDTVLLEKIDRPEVEIVSIKGAKVELPRDPNENTATAGLVQLIDDLKLKYGFKVSIEKGIPMGSGMGGSAASAVAAIVAANEFLETKLSKESMAGYALIGEAKASGSFHADNVAPALMGGMTLARIRNASGKIPLVEMTAIPVPKEIYCVLVLPELSLQTKEARGILKPEVALKTHVEQSANLAGFIAGCYRGDIELIARSFTDRIVEPQRAHLIPGFHEVQVAAVTAGAMGCSISGAGPSIFAWANGKLVADRCLAAMLDAFQAHDIAAQGWASPIDQEGARVLP